MKTRTMSKKENSMMLILRLRQYSRPNARTNRAINPAANAMSNLVLNVTVTPVRCACVGDTVSFGMPDVKTGGRSQIYG